MRLTVRKAAGMTTICNLSARDWKCPPSILEGPCREESEKNEERGTQKLDCSEGKIPLEGPISPPGFERTRAEAAYFAATPAISTKYLGAASRASTVARAGGFAGSIQASHTEFMSSKYRMSASQMVAERSLDLLVPAAARRSSIFFKICWV